MTADKPKRPLEELVGRVVVLDAVSPFVIVGTLASFNEHYFELHEADVHDLRDTLTTRELYALESRQLGVRVNRRRVFVRGKEIVSVSLLDDVIK